MNVLAACGDAGAAAQTASSSTKAVSAITAVVLQKFVSSTNRSVLERMRKGKGGKDAHVPSLKIVCTGILLSILMSLQFFATLPL